MQLNIDEVLVTFEEDERSPVPIKYEPTVFAAPLARLDLIESLSNLVTINGQRLNPENCYSGDLLIALKQLGHDPPPPTAIAPKPVSEPGLIP